MCVGLIDAVRAAVLTDHCSEHTRAEHPLVQFPSALAERIFKTLLRPGSETVERDRKACNAHFRHNTLPSVSVIDQMMFGERVDQLPAWARNRHPSFSFSYET